MSEAFELLKAQFRSSGANPFQKGKRTEVPKCAVFNEIGILATEGDDEALRFIVKHLTHKDPFLRFAAVGFLRVIPSQHLKRAEIDPIARLKEIIRTEKDKKILLYAKAALEEKRSS